MADAIESISTAQAASYVQDLATVTPLNPMEELAKLKGLTLAELRDGMENSSMFSGNSERIESLFYGSLDYITLNTGGERPGDQVNSLG